MSEILNARDRILQAATLRTEPVTLPPTVVVPPGQIGAGSLPGSVTGSDGSKIISADELKVSTIKTNQIQDLSGNLMFQANGRMAFNKVDGLGPLASRASITAPELGVGTLAADVIYSGQITAEQVTSGRFTGKVFEGGVFNGGVFNGVTFNGTTFNSVVFNTDIIRVTNLESFGYLDAVNGYFDNDVRCTNVYANLCVVGPAGFAGDTGSRVLLRSQLYNADMVLDGIGKSVQIRII